MSVIATGVNKYLTFKKQSGVGVIATTSSAQNLRRTQSTLDFKKGTYQSKELKPSQQLGDYRHGVVSVDGTVSGELSVGTYQQFFESLCRMLAVNGKTFTLPASGVANSGNICTITGDLTAQSAKVGTIVKDTNNVNYLIAKCDTTSTVIVRLDELNSTLASSAALTQVGKTTYVPQSGQTRDYYTIEHWFSDIAQSERFTDCVVTQADVKLPASGMAEVDFQIKGLNMSTGQAQYYSSPSAATTGAVLAAANGALLVQGVVVGLITGMNFSIKGGHTTIGGVVGQNNEPDIFPGTVTVDGQVTVLFQDATFRDYFVNETEVSIVAAFTGNNLPACPTVAYAFPRCKMGGATKDDGEKGLVLTMPFVALEALPTQTGNYQTTCVISDTAFV